jgi:hypothetical protein
MIWEFWWVWVCCQSMDQFWPEFCSCLMRGKIKPILHGFQVQNIIFLDCLTMHELEFCTKSYSCFSFLCLFVCYKSKTRTIYYLSSFLNKVIYLGLHYVILVFPRLWGLFQVYNDVSDHILWLLVIILNLSKSFIQTLSLIFIIKYVIFSLDTIRKTI